MTIERVKHSGALIVSQFIGEGQGEYLFTRTYYGYAIKQAKQLFKIAVEGEAK